MASKGRHVNVKQILYYRYSRLDVNLLWRVSFYSPSLSAILAEIAFILQVWFALAY